MPAARRRRQIFRGRTSRARRYRAGRPRPTAGASPSRRVLAMHFLSVPLVAALVLLQDGAKKEPPAPAEVVAAARRIAAQQPAEHPVAPRTVDVLHYVVRLAVDLRAHRIEGSDEVTLHVFGAARRTIELDADELAIKDVVDANQQPLAHAQKGT